MPELPEVETVRRSLLPALLSGGITEIHTSTLALRRRRIDRVALSALVGAQFVAARRHGKYLLLDTSAQVTLLVHLGMSGRLLLVDAAVPHVQHTHVRLTLSTGKELRYVDPRRFGLVRPYATETIAKTEELSILGPDPLGSLFTSADFSSDLARTKRDLKSALLDQGTVAGLGNIYVAEALFVARLSPRRRAHRLSMPERARLFGAIIEVLERGVQNRGTTFSDYVDANGELGSNQHTLFVYGRAGEPCRVCATLIRKIVQAGRATFFCARCQSATQNF